MAQYEALTHFGILTPRTIAAVGRASILEAAARFEAPFITKHNRGGKGLGVMKFDDSASLRAYVESAEYEPPIDGVTLVQAYRRFARAMHRSLRIVGAEFQYAVRVDTGGSFELCPADVCAPADAFCPAGEFPAFPTYDYRWLRESAH